jgi:hypothetical protein
VNIQNVILIVIVILFVHDLLLLCLWDRLYNHHTIKNRITAFADKLISPLRRQALEPTTVPGKTRNFLVKIGELLKRIPVLSDEPPEGFIRTETASSWKLTFNLILDLILLAGILTLGYIGQYHFTRYMVGEMKGLEYYGYALLVLIILIFRKQSYPRQPKKISLPPTLTAEVEKKRLKISDFIAFISQNKIRVVSFVFSIVITIIYTVLLVHRQAELPHWDLLVLWLISWISFALTFIQWQKLNLPNFIKSNYIDILSIVGFTGLGMYLRFISLGDLPNVVSGDEGMIGNFIVEMYKGNIHNMFGTSNGNSNLYLFMLAGLMKVFGISIKVLRTGSAIGGVLVIPIIYLFAKEVFNRRVAWVSTALITTSHFHLHFSRIMSVTSVQDCLFSTLSLYLFYTGLKRRSLTRMVLGGTALGFALYVYMGARLIILLLPIYILILLFTQRDLVLKNWKIILVFFAALVIISIPIINYAVTYPDSFNARANQVGVIQSGWLDTETVITGKSKLEILANLFKLAFMTTIYLHSFGFHMSPLPMLDFVTSVFFVAGLFISLIYTLKSKYLLLNGWFWSGVLVGGALVVAPNDNSYRILIIFPAMCLFVGIGFDKLLSFFDSKPIMTKTIAPLITLLFIVTFSVINVKAYFIDYLPMCVYEGENTRLASYVAKYTAELDPSIKPVLITYPVLEIGTHQSMELLTNKREFLQYKDPLDDSFSKIDKTISYVFFVIPKREDDLKRIEEVLPGGWINHIYDCNKEISAVYHWNP